MTSHTGGPHHDAIKELAQKIRDRERHDFDETLKAVRVFCDSLALQRETLLKDARVPCEVAVPSAIALTVGEAYVRAVVLAVEQITRDEQAEG